MKKPSKNKLTRQEQKALTEMLAGQTTRVGTRKSENKGFTDTPIFVPRNQEELFKPEAKQPLFALKKKLRIESVQDYIAANIHSEKIAVASWERWGDRNVSASPGFRLNWLRKNGSRLDIVALEMQEEFPSRDQQELIEAIVDFMRSHPDANDLRRYLTARLEDQHTCTTCEVEKKAPDGKASADEIACFVDKARAALPAKVLREETRKYLAAPAQYFGPLFNIPDCSEDLFALPDQEAGKVIRAIRASVSKSTKPNTAMRKVKTARKKTAQRNAQSYNIQKDIIRDNMVKRLTRIQMNKTYSDKSKLAIGDYVVIPNSPGQYDGAVGFVEAIGANTVTIKAYLRGEGEQKKYYSTTKSFPKASVAYFHKPYKKRKASANSTTMKKAKTARKSTATKKAVSAKAKKPTAPKKKTTTKKAVVARTKKAVTPGKARKAPSAAQLRAQKKIRSVNTLAVRKIYDAGRNNRPVPTWKGVSKAAAREIFKK